MLADSDGIAAVRLARASVAASLGRGAAEAPDLPQVFGEPRGVFVTWKRARDEALRGCIGYPLPVLPLRRAVEEAAAAAAFEDPRFPPIRAEELPELLVEVSVLALPRPIAVADRPGGVRPGIDGLIVRRGRASGLLLPQVAPEQGWGAEAFLDGTCEKAGLPPGAWRRPDVDVRAFEAEVFGETSPGGPVVRHPPKAR